MKAAATIAAAGALPVACGVEKPGAPTAASKTLKILQWSHFVPGYDRWFDGVFTRQWGARNGTEVVVDHIAAMEINARAAAEAAAGKGHDLFLFQAPPASYEDRVIDHREILEAVARRHGPPIDLARRSSVNPRTGKVFAFVDSFVPDPGNYRTDLWAETGYPNGPDTWEDLRAGGRRIREKRGIPVGIGLSQEQDSNMALRALLWSFGGAEQNERGEVAVNSKETVEALTFARALYRETMTPEVFTWDPSSNNRMMLSGRSSFVQNAISITRAGEKENPEGTRKIGLCPPLSARRRLASAHLTNCYVIWKFAENREGASQFLVDLMDAFPLVFEKSEFYNFPCYPSTVPDLEDRLATDPKAQPRGKYRMLARAFDWSVNVGFPGYATAPIDEAFETFLIPSVFARVARDELSPAAGAGLLERELARIFDRWRGGAA